MVTTIPGLWDLVNALQSQGCECQKRFSEITEHTENREINDRK
jgi:hypothetical protein